MKKILFFLIFIQFISAEMRIPGDDISQVSSMTFLKKGPNGSKLYRIEAPDSVYASTDLPYLLDLTAKTSYEQGYDAGYLLGKEAVENYNNLFLKLLGNKWWRSIVSELVGLFLDEQWNNYLSKDVPQSYLDEVKGISDGAYSAHRIKNVGKLITRAIVLSNLPGTLDNFKFIIEDETKNTNTNGYNWLQYISGPYIIQFLSKMSSYWKGLSCSMFGVWGSRTLNGELFSGRNLDWLTNTGISKYKLITIHRPPDGYVHCTVGWAGFWGAITGMSIEGITVHEANLESDDITFRGFPWVLRLRHVMTKAKTLSEAIDIFESTNSTVGFNHAVGSAVDKELRVIETMKGVQAVFSDNDPREMVGYEVEGYRNIGAPRSEAVYRTNHGYDPYTIQHFMWNKTEKNSYSIDRYLLFPLIFDDYSSRNITISAKEAINITAILGDKGRDNMFDCGGSGTGGNILSTTFDPSNLIMYVSWENSVDGTWTPAACNSYLQLNMKSLFTPPWVMKDST